MKKSVLVILVVCTFSSKAQNRDGGGLYLGANIGIPLSATFDLASFNYGFDAAYLIDVTGHLEVGPLVGYSHFVGDGTYRYDDDDFIIIRDYKDVGFVPIAVSGRFYFGNRRFFGGADLGFALNVSGDAKNGFFGRAKFGFDLGKINLIASFSGISGGTDYDDSTGISVVTLSGYHTANFGIEFNL